MTPNLSTSGIPQGTVDILADYYLAAQRKLARFILKPAGATQSQAWRMARAAQLISQVDDELRTLKKQTVNWLGSPTTFAKAVEDGIARADSQAVAAGVRPPASAPADNPLHGSFALVDRGAVAVFARDAAADLGKAETAMGNGAKTLLRKTAQLKLSEQDINKILAGGLIEGQPTAVIRELREALRAVHGDKIVLQTRGGPMEFDVGKYARLVVRTKTREATTYARHERLQQVGIDLVSIVGRVSNTFCTAFLGQVFSLSGKDPHYPPLSSLPGNAGYPVPPFHPNCSKSTRPFVAALATPTQLKDAAPTPDTLALAGKTATQAQALFKSVGMGSDAAKRYKDTAAAMYGQALPAPKPVPAPAPVAPAPVVATGPTAVKTAADLKTFFARTDTKAAGIADRIAQVAKSAEPDNARYGQIQKRIEAIRTEYANESDIKKRHTLVKESFALSTERVAIEGRHAARIAEAHEALKVQGPTNTIPQGKVDAKLSVAQGKIDTAVKWVSERTAAVSGVPARKVTFEVATSGRAHWNTNAGIGRPGASHGSVFATEYTPEHTLAHELGHELEDTLPGARKAVNLFLEERVGKEAFVSLKAKYPQCNFDPSEMGREDEFAKTVGYPLAHYIGKKYSSDAAGLMYTEVLSVGIETLYQNPMRFAKDPEYLKLIVGILHGEVA